MVGWFVLVVKNRFCCCVCELCTMSGENERRLFGVRETSWLTTGDKCARWETSFLALYFNSKVGDKLAGLRDKLVFGRQVGQPETSWPGVPETSWPSLGDKFFNYDATRVTLRSFFLLCKSRMVLPK